MSGKKKDKPVVDKTFGMKSAPPALFFQSLHRPTHLNSALPAAAPTAPSAADKKGAKGQAFVQSVQSGKAAAMEKAKLANKTPEQIEAEKLKKCARSGATRCPAPRRALTRAPPAPRPPPPGSRRRRKRSRSSSRSS